MRQVVARLEAQTQSVVSSSPVSYFCARALVAKLEFATSMAAIEEASAAVPAPMAPMTSVRSAPSAQHGRVLGAPRALGPLHLLADRRWRGHNHEYLGPVV